MPRGNIWQRHNASPVDRREQEALRWLDAHPEQLARCERMSDNAWCEWIKNFKPPEEGKETEI